MPEGRALPYKYMPRLGANLGITFGNPIPAEELRTYSPLGGRGVSGGVERVGRIAETSLLGQVQDTVHDCKSGGDLSRARSDLTAVVQKQVEALGRAVSGQSLRGIHEA